MKAKAERAVLVTTAHKGVFFGYAAKTGGPNIKLRAAIAKWEKSPWA